jgi:hypothetical protein
VAHARAAAAPPAAGQPAAAEMSADGQAPGAVAEPSEPRPP